MATYIDISVPSDEQTLVYPGDEKPRFHWGSSHEKGDLANVGYFQGGLHFGTHVDAPWHFIHGGKKLHEVPLERWVGPCWVADLTTAERCLTAEVLEAAGIPEGTRRLLCKTRNGATDYWREPWKEDFVYVERSGAQWCVGRGIGTVGLDYQTVDPQSEPSFPAHMELLGNGVMIIENLRLREVQAGEYELIAAPVNLQGVDGAWVRALLRRYS